MIDKNVIEKKKNTFLSHYGVDNIFKDPKFKDDMRKLCNEKREHRIQERDLIPCKLCSFIAVSRYGLSRHLKRNHTIADKEYYDKYLKQDNEELCKMCGKESRFYGFSIGYLKYCSKKCAWNDPELKHEREVTCFNKYGVNHPNKRTDSESKENRVNSSKQSWKTQYNTREAHNCPFCARIGIKETECIDKLQTYTNEPILRNPGMFGFFVDGHIEKFNLIIEYDENHHYDNNGNQVKTDIDRQIILESKGFQFFRIKESEWLTNKDKVILDFQNLVGVLLN